MSVGNFISVRHVPWGFRHRLRCVALHFNPAFGFTVKYLHRPRFSVWRIFRKIFRKRKCSKVTQTSAQNEVVTVICGAWTALASDTMQPVTRLGRSSAVCGNSDRRWKTWKENRRREQEKPEGKQAEIDTQPKFINLLLSHSGGRRMSGRWRQRIFF